MSEKIVVRQATTADVEAILNIYAKYVSDTTVSFEVEVPTVEAFQTRMEQIQAQFPLQEYGDVPEEPKLPEEALTIEEIERILTNSAQMVSVSPKMVAKKG